MTREEETIKSGFQKVPLRDGAEPRAGYVAKRTCGRATTDFCGAVME